MEGFEAMQEELKRKIEREEAKGNIVTNFPTPAPSGLRYSKNFAASLKAGRFAMQEK